MKPHGDNFLGTRRGSSIARGVAVCVHKKNSISEDEMHFSHREEQIVNAEA